MADDLDDLLNEVESKFCASRSDGRKGKSPVTRGSTSNSSERKASKRDQDLHSMIDDIFDDSLENDPCSKSYPPGSRTSKDKSIFPSEHARKGSVGASGRKCFPVFIAGPEMERGPSSSVNQRACGSLRCTACDFNVAQFLHYSWHSSTDYLFLRNNMPDLDRLMPKLVRKKGVCAYACQCSWRSVRELTDLQSDLDLKWVCGKH